MDTSAETDKQPNEEKTPEAADSSEAQAEPATETSEAAQATNKPEKRHSKKGQRSKPRGNKGSPTLKHVSDRFAACGRCSFFWSGYRVILGEAGQETAVAESQSGWLNLEWNSQIHDLLFKSYGIRLDVNFYHYEGCCKECRRRFTYQAPEKSDAPSQCAIEISPHGAN